jgi:hypothetical protein
MLDQTKAVASELAALGIAVGQLKTPAAGYALWADVWGADNGGFKGFNEEAFRRMLTRLKPHRATCRFVAVPDVFLPDVHRGDARRTLEVFLLLEHDLRPWPRALVLQDGIEDLEIPWGKLDAVFVGGSDSFKGSAEAMACAKAAKILGKWVHVGRVNTPERFDRWQGIADSCDGTGLAKFRWMRRELGEGLPLLAERVGTSAPSS